MNPRKRASSDDVTELQPVKRSTVPLDQQPYEGVPMYTQYMQENLYQPQVMPHEQSQYAMPVQQYLPFDESYSSHGASSCDQISFRDNSNSPSSASSVDHGYSEASQQQFHHAPSPYAQTGIQHCRNATKSDPDSKFCTVPGRLSLMGNGGKYDVSTAEIRRRLNDPECLNSSILSAILRKAKTANNGSGLRNDLKNWGVELPTGRRKHAVTTLCTALLEEEAEQLASDLDKLTRTHYPFHAIVEHLRAKSMGSNMEEKKRDLVGAVRILSDISEVICAVDCPLGEKTPEPFHDIAVQNGMDNYSLYTHGLGVANQRTWVGAFETLARQWLMKFPTDPVPPTVYSHFVAPNVQFNP